MERHAKNPVLVLFLLLVLSCLLVYPPSPTAPHPVYFSSMPRSLRLGSQQQYPTTLKHTSSLETMAIAAGTNLGKAAPRMDFEVEDCPPPDHNHHHGGH